MIKNRETEKKKIDEQERALAKKEHNLHQAFFLATAASNTNPLGADRNHTKYYWFDAASGSVSIMGGGFEEFMMSYRNKQKSPSGLEWSTGRLFIATPTNGTRDDGGLNFKWGYIDDTDKVRVPDLIV
jgi:hypothetical protein